MSGSSNFANVNEWVSSPAYELVSWDYSRGSSMTGRDSTWEMVLRPGDFEDNHMLFNTGGGNGLAWLLEGSVLDFRIHHTSEVGRNINLSVDLSTLGSGSATDFYHVVGTVDVDGQAEGIGQLFVNAVATAPAETSTGTINDWSGGAPAGLRGADFSIPGDGSFGDVFTGDVAAFNYYEEEIVTSGDIQANYLAFSVPEPATVSLILLAGGGLLMLLRRRR